MEEKQKSGFINIIGRPNVGKSSLLNTILGKKMAIVTNKAQTTRHRLLAIYNKDNIQLIFSDTPGIIKPAYGLQKRMMGFVKEAMQDADVLLIMTDITESPEVLNDYSPFKKCLNIIKENKVPVILLINKIDLINEEAKLETLFNAWRTALSSLRPKDNEVKILPVSALHKGNITPLLNELISLLPEGPEYFPKDMESDKLETFFISETIREKIFIHYDKEIPYSCEVVVPYLVEEKDIYKIDAEIVVSKKSHQPIIVGKKGAGVKRIGTLARKDLEELFGKKVFLQLKVKTRENWKDRSIFLNQYGYRK
jgi:GTP-binding protein Era